LRGIVGLWTGCVSGALLDGDYLTRLSTAGFTDAAVEVTRTFDREELHRMSDLIGDEQLPEGWTLDAVIDELDGAFASAFVRARKAA